MIASHIRPLLLCLLAPVAAAQNYENSRAVEAIGGAPARLLQRVQNPPLGLPAVPVPARNPLTEEGVALGRKLFFDRRLSFGRTLSCAMCHVPEQGFTQAELKTPVGTEGRFVKRNSPSLFNVGYRPRLFHDGREASLENQVWQPLLKPNEMANPSISFVLETIAAADDYRGRFEALYPQGLTAETLGMALASYQRALLAGNSAFDRWYFGGDTAAMPEQARRGWALFNRAGCRSCHTVAADHAHFTDDGFYDTGVGYQRSMGIGRGSATLRLAPGVEVSPSVSFPLPAASDLGRYEATGRAEDRWRYRVPTLRNVALTGPYMHDGSLPTLAAVVRWYNRGGAGHAGQDPRVRPLQLAPAEQAALVAFLEALTSADTQALVSDARSEAIGDSR